MASTQSLSSMTNEQWIQQIETASEAIQISSEKLAVQDISPKSIAQTVDHTLLRLDATEAQIDTLCNEAKEYGFKSVCVRLPWVTRCIAALTDTSVLVACVVGFHEGTHSTTSKLEEAAEAVKAGATELDVVIKWPQLQEKQYASIYTELAALRARCPAPTVIKLIFETSQLDEAQILAACHLAAAAELDFVKTSTGFNGRGATVRDVQIMRSASQFYASAEGAKLLGLTSGSRQPMKVKASGGVRTFADAVNMLETGAERIGASSGVKIVQEAQGGKSGESTSGKDGY